MLQVSKFEIVVLRLFVAISVWALVNCANTDKKDVRGTVAPSTNSKSCSDLGGTIDKETNVCVCDDGKPAKDPGCSKAPGVEVVMACYQSTGKWDAGSKTCICPSTHKWDGNACAPVDSSADESPQETELGSLVRSACKTARGEWWAAEEYCACPSGMVLSGNQCVKLDGVITKEVCAGAVRYGAWVGEKCLCDDGRFFSPGRGGCISRPTASERVHKAVCTNSLNQGEWDAQKSRCECPATQKELIWHNETCQDKATVSPKDICAGDYNKAVWDLQKNICKCALGTIWVNKVCESLQTVSPKAACESDVNKGKWDEARRTCLCTGGQGWTEAIKSCNDSGIASWQLLCTQSGGTPGLEVGICQCGAKYEKKVLAPQKFEYCMLKPPGDKPPPETDTSVPDWIKILMGIIKT